MADSKRPTSVPTAVKIVLGYYPFLDHKKKCPKKKEQKCASECPIHKLINEIMQMLS